MGKALSLSVDSKGIARLVFDDPDEKVNTVSSAILDELDENLQKLESDRTIRALLVLSGKDDSFIAGANLKELYKLGNDLPEAEKLIAKGHAVFSRLENLPYPVIAVIHGTCLGGGTELALACHYRIITDHPKTQIGLPEVQLGFFPGWGGTQRLPRLVGLEAGLNMILTGKSVNGLKAYKMRLADDITAVEFLDNKVADFTTKVMTPEGKNDISKRRKLKGIRRLLLEKNPIGRSLLFYLSKKEVLRNTKGHYPAPINALELIKATCTQSLHKGLLMEQRAFLENLRENSVLARNLIQVFFDQKMLKSDPGVPQGIKPKPIEYPTVIGAGTMGSGIAWLLSDAGYEVRLKDISWEQIAKGYAAVWDIYYFFIKRKKYSLREAKIKFLRLSGTIDYSGFQRSDLVIEAASETLKIKEEIFAALENTVSKEAIIATNTSSLTLAELSKGRKFPERFIALHFFNPANRMPLVEVVPGEKTPPQLLVTAVEFCKKIGKTPIVVKDCHGFLVNRIVGASMSEVFTLLEQTGDMNLITKAWNDFGWPMDPFTLADEVGNDVNYKVLSELENAYGSRMKVPMIVKLMASKGLNGKKTGKGFFIYKGKDKKPNPELPSLLAGIDGSIAIQPQEIMDRVLAVMVNEAARCLEEGIVSKPNLIDIALILGLGFPPFHGGLLRYADRKGVSNIVNLLKRLQAKYGERYAPCQLLLKTDKFYPEG